MAMIKTFKELFKVESSKWFFKSTRDSDEIEELSSISNLKNDVGNFFGLSIFLDIGVNTIFDLVNDINVLNS